MDRHEEKSFIITFTVAFFSTPLFFPLVYVISPLSFLTSKCSLAAFAATVFTMILLSAFFSTFIQSPDSTLSLILYPVYNIIFFLFIMDSLILLTLSAVLNGCFDKLRNWRAELGVFIYATLNTILFTPLSCFWGLCLTGKCEDGKLIYLLGANVGSLILFIAVLLMQTLGNFSSLLFMPGTSKKDQDLVNNCATYSILILGVWSTIFFIASLVVLHFSKNSLKPRPTSTRATGNGILFQTFNEMNEFSEEFYGRPPSSPAIVNPEEISLPEPCQTYSSEALSTSPLSLPPPSYSEAINTSKPY